MKLTTQVSYYKKRTREVLESEGELRKLKQLVTEKDAQISQLQRQQDKINENNVLLNTLKGFSLFRRTRSLDLPNLVDYTKYTALQTEVEKLRQSNRILSERDQNLELQKEKVNELQSIIQSQNTMLQKYYLVCSEHDLLMEEHQKLYAASTWIGK